MQDRVLALAFLAHIHRWVRRAGKEGDLSMKCTKCGSEIGQQDIFPAFGIAKCRSCGTVVALREMRVDSLDRDQKSQDVLPENPLPTTEVPLSDIFKVEQNSDKLSIEWAWSNAGAGGILHPIIGIGLLLTVFVFVVVYFFGLGLVGLAVGVVFTCVVMPLIILFQYMKYNKTRIEATRGTLTVRHFPLPCSGNQKIPVDMIDQIFTKELSRGDSEKDSRVTFEYHVFASLRGGKRIGLISDLAEPTYALYLEQCLEKYLGIVDKPMEGEMPVLSSQPAACSTGENDGGKAIASMKCPRCGNTFAMSNIYQDVGAALCHEHWCRQLTDLKAERRSPVDIPEKLAVRSGRDSLLIDVRWRDTSTIIGLGFFAFLGLANVCLQLFDEVENLYFVVICAVMFVCSLCGIIYNLVDHTFIEVRRGIILIRHAPLPWFGNKELRFATDDRLFCMGLDNSGRSYKLCALLNPNQKTGEKSVGLKPGEKVVDIIALLRGPAQALYLNQYLEEYIGVENRTTDTVLQKSG